MKTDKNICPFYNRLELCSICSNISHDFEDFEKNICLRTSQGAALLAKPGCSSRQESDCAEVSADNVCDSHHRAMTLPKCVHSLIFTQVQEKQKFRFPLMHSHTLNTFIV